MSPSSPPVSGIQRIYLPGYNFLHLFATVLLPELTPVHSTATTPHPCHPSVFMYDLHVSHSTLSTGILITVCQSWSWATKRQGGKKKRGGATRQGIRWQSHRGWPLSLLLSLLLLFVAVGGCYLFVVYFGVLPRMLFFPFFFFSLPSYCLHSSHVSNPCIDRLNCRRTHPDGSLLGYTRCHIPGSTCRDFH